MIKNTFTVAVAILSFSHISSVYARGPLTFEDRVKAQEAIERVYYAHRIWPKENKEPKPAFEKMVSKAVIEAKVTDYLKKCNALDKFWQRPIEPHQLQAEIDRMANGTKDPKTLKELFTALGDDPYTIAECLARPVLADRLIHNWYSFDTRFHGGLRAEAEALRGQLTPSNFNTLGGERYSPLHVELENDAVPDRKGEDGVIKLDPEALSRISSEFPAAMEISGIEETFEAFVIRLTESKSEGLIVGGTITFRKTDFVAWFDSIKGDLGGQIHGSEGNFRAPAVSPLADPTSPDSWKSLWYFLEPRSYHTAVWTGTEMIIWGGNSGGVYYNTGGIYAPSTDTWLFTSTGENCPSGRYLHTAVWTGTEMIIWGGDNFNLNTGGRYNPSTDTWLSTSTGENCPEGRVLHTAVWTGSEMIIWGGSAVGDRNDGGRYIPATDTWQLTSIGANCPSARIYHTAVWKNSEMIVWGGWDRSSFLNTGSRYTPATDSWTAISTGANCPSGRGGHTAVWTGSEMIIWGGFASGARNDGGRYNPLMDIWLSISTGTNCPYKRESHTAIWTGTEMVIWGGFDGGSYLNTGGCYSPSADTWLATSTGVNCPSERGGHTAIWTGAEMVIWGGGTNTGGKYTPSSDSWVSTSTGTNYPSARFRHTGVWSGTEMIVWGGYDGSNYSNTGWRYTPSLDSWVSTSTGTNCPLARADHIAVWTGTDVILWGGYDGNNYFNTGGMYTPSSDSWSVTAIGANCPSARTSHTAVWTGTEMIVWGGWDGVGYPVTGGRYTPTTNAWTPTSTGTNCPSARVGHTAIWTGKEMVVWGGNDATYILNTGGRYVPLLDSWTAISTAPNCPSDRSRHTAVWTGAEMIVWGGVPSQTNTGGRYNPSLDSWTAMSTGTSCPSGREYHTGVWTGTEMIIWGGDYDGSFFNSGGCYTPSTDSWVSTSSSVNCPSARSRHTAIWTGEEMIIWDGAYTGSGGIYYPNTPPRAVPTLQTSLGGDATFALCTGETLSLAGSYSTDGSNPLTTAPYHDKLDSIVSYEWDLNGDASFDTQCSISTSGIDLTGVTPAALTEAELVSYGISSPGVHPIWLRVTDEVGVKSCTSINLTVQSTPGAASITGVSDIDPCSLNGVTITFQGGSGAMSHNLLRDGAEVAWGIASPYLHKPGNTSSHSYVVRAVKSACTTDSLPVAGIDANDKPGMPLITTIADDSPCTLGITVTFAGGSGAASHSLLRDGSVVAAGITSPYPYNPGDTASHSYVVRAVKNSCSTDSPSQAFADTNNAPGAPGNIGISDNDQCAQSGITITFAVGSGADTHNLVRDGSVVATGITSPFFYNPNDSIGHGYQVSAVKGSCAVDSVSQSFTDANHTPSPSISGPSPACPSSTLSTGAFSSYQWYRNGSILSGATSQSYLAPAAGNYTVRVTEANGCQATSAPFTVNANPVPTITGPSSGCPTVTLSTTAFATYQWTKNGADISGATGQTHMAASSGDYRVRVTNAVGCTGTSAVKTVTILPGPSPEVTGANSNTCPETTVALSTATYSSYQWRHDGLMIPGATNSSYQAGVYGNYSVIVTDGTGCSGTSADFPVFVDFCPNSETSPSGAIFPLRIVKDQSSSTGFYIYFQRLDSTDGFNVYEGNISSYYSHAGALGNLCAATVTDLGTGQMRAEITPSAGNQYYLVTAFGSGSEGPSGFRSNGQEIDPVKSTCAP